MESVPANFNVSSMEMLLTTFQWRRAIERTSLPLSSRYEAKNLAKES